MVLGEVDYGLYGVVGGLTAFILLFNNVLASAVSRYYAFSVGRASIKGNETAGLEECRKWFTVALTLHLSIAVLFTAIGYPLGCWAVRHYLVIPTDRVSACIWVWRFVCLSCFAGMINVPFNAMYYAKQDSHQHHFEKRAIFVGRGVMAVGTNESNTYRRTERKNTDLRSANQYSRTQPITCRKWRFLNRRGAVGRLDNGFSAIHTDTNVGILDDNR